MPTRPSPVRAAPLLDPAPPVAPRPVRLIPADPAAPVVFTAGEAAAFAFELGWLAYFLATAAGLLDAPISPGLRRGLVAPLTQLTTRLTETITIAGPRGLTPPEPAPTEPTP
jgi:hypothetical protein